MLAYPFSLALFNTFKLDVNCNSFISLDNINQLSEVSSAIKKAPQHLILGGGSNILFTKNYDGLVIKNNLKGITLINEDTQHIYLQAMAGEWWQDFVLHCVNNNYGGVENLSLIPGTVGATPIQNIGAYGVEVKNTIHSVTFFDIETEQLHTYTNAQCEFGYRESIFKHTLKNKIIITAVVFKLTKHPQLNTKYGVIAEQLIAMHITTPTIKDVSDAVIAIRQSKLPNPAITGNAGSFFKNPVVTHAVFDTLITTHPTLSHYADVKGVKLAAGWLIEQCGLKGYTHNGAAVHSKQALVLINANNATGTDVLALATHVQQTVYAKFGVQLEMEVNVL
ncbi:MAG: UDP-N-acetylmuramate dehydrogenase [Bacteroidia bacterium]|nr:UDP-N-acetylmuramate dehydrogenase [Bacteroidia bacterium]